MLKPPIDEKLLEFHFPAVLEKKLSNGLTLLIIEKPQLPKVYIRLGMDFGTKNDPLEKSGLLQLLASSLKKGTANASYYQLVDKIEQVGGELDTTVNEDFFIIYGEFLRDHLEDGLGILGDLLFYPVFPAEEVEKERLKQLADLENEKSSPEFLAHRRMDKALYHPHPYASHRSSESLQNISRADLIRFQQDSFTPEHSCLVLAGRINGTEALHLAEKYFSGWKRTDWKPYSLPVPDAIPENEIYLVHRPQSQQTNILLGNQLFSRRHPDFEKVLVMNKILGGGATGRLFMHLREKKGFTYGAYSNLETYQESGAFLANAEVRSEVTVAALQAFLEEFQKIQQQPVPQQELQDAKRFLVGIFPLQNETPSSIAALALKQRLYQLGKDYWNHYLAAISRVSAPEVMETAKHWIRPLEITTVVVGDADRLFSQLSALGKVKVFDVEDQPLDR
jgi:zinc protease